MERARVVDREAASLLSSPSEIAAGRFRYRVLDPALPDLKRDDFLVTYADSAVVRRVLSAKRSGDELVVETGHAYWHEAMQGGTYGMTIPFDRDAPATLLSGEEVPPLPLSVTGGFETTVGSLEKTFERTDLCKWADDYLGNFQLCHRELEFEKELGPIEVALSGTIDSLEILGGNVKAVGVVEISGTVDAGGLSGGTPPVFAPCNRAAYVGCITTPTGAALIDWLRYYAPGIPDGSLPAVRLCIPGLPVRVKAGYWDYSGFLPRWVLPVFEQCRITSNGTLPEVIFPGITAATMEVRPRITGRLRMFVIGDGSLGIDIGIPNLSLSKKYEVGNDFNAEAKLGLFIGAEFGMKNGGGIFELTFDQEGAITQNWSKTNGWTGGFTKTKSEKSLQPLLLIRPDSVTLKLAVKLKAEAGLCIAIVACEEPTGDPENSAIVGVEPLPPTTGNLFEIGITLKLAAMGEAFVEGTLTREVVSASPPVDNAKIAIEGGLGYELEGELKIPATGWILPNVPRKFKLEDECCRTSLADLWLQGKLEVRTNTTGASPDPNGYVVNVRRADTLPRIIKAGSHRLNSAVDHGSPLALNALNSDTVVFSRAAPCLVLYTDIVMPLAVTAFGSAIPGVNAAGEGSPSFAITFPCDLLIARYFVTLSDVSENCTVTGGAQKEVWLKSRDVLLQRQDTAYVDFAIVCNGTDPLGSLALTTTASAGPDYAVSIDGVAKGTMGSHTTRTFTGLRAGNRTVTLTGGPANCLEPGALGIAIPAGDTAEITVAVPCTAADPMPVPGQLTVAVTTTGAGTDPDGYQVIVDGVRRAALAANGDTVINNFPASTPSVLGLASVAGNCRAASALPRTFTFNASRTPVTIPIAMSCVSTAIDTVLATVEPGAAGAVTLRLESGSVLTVTGASRTELQQLAGMRLVAWGVKTGTSVDVYGYELESTIADPRWTGIVTARAGKLWLFGAEAIELVNAPAALASSVGAYVWIGGTRTGDTGPVKPTVFGTIRSAP